MGSGTLAEDGGQDVADVLQPVVLLHPLVGICHRQAWQGPVQGRGHHQRRRAGEHDSYQILLSVRRSKPTRVWPTRIAGVIGLHPTNYSGDLGLLASSSVSGHSSV